jgi:hypothetical protein
LPSELTRRVKIERIGIDSLTCSVHFSLNSNVFPGYKEARYVI